MFNGTLPIGLILATGPTGWHTPAGYIQPYDLALLLAMLGGAALFLWQMVRIGVPWRTVLAATPLAVAVPVALARITDTLAYRPGTLLTEPIRILEVLGGGLSSHGAILGIVVLAATLSRLFHKPVARLADSLTWWGLAGVGATRIADHLHATGIGIASDLPWAMRFTGGGKVPRHPVNLYELIVVAGLLVMNALLTRRGTTIKRPGLAASATLVVYFGSRLLLDGIRDVPLLSTSPRFTIAQLLSVPLFALGLALLWKTIRGAAETKTAPENTRLAASTRDAHHRGRWALALVATLVAAFILGALGSGLVLGINFRSGACRLSLPFLRDYGLFWTLPLTVIALLGGWLGGRVENWSNDKARVALAAVLFFIASVAAIVGMLASPMACAAVLVLYISLVLPFVHTIRDLIVYYTGALAATGVLAVLIALAGRLGQPCWPAVPMVYGLAAVFTERVRRCLWK